MRFNCRYRTGGEERAKRKRHACRFPGFSGRSTDDARHTHPVILGRNIKTLPTTLDKLLMRVGETRCRNNAIANMLAASAIPWNIERT